MRTGEQQPRRDGWDIHRNKNGKGQDSCSNCKAWDAAGYVKVFYFVVLGDEVGADAQKDK